jgi:hypothetical protein
VRTANQILPEAHTLDPALGDITVKLNSFVENGEALMRRWVRVKQIKEKNEKDRLPSSRISLQPG